MVFRLPTDELAGKPNFGAENELLGKFQGKTVRCKGVVNLDSLTVLKEQ
jgi:hypothetical protein